MTFDIKVIAAGGYKEPVSLQQIRSHLEMESHEEKLHIMILESKKEAAKDQAREAARSIRERQKEQQRLGISPMQGIGSNTNANVFEDTSCTSKLCSLLVSDRLCRSESFGAFCQFHIAYIIIGKVCERRIYQRNATTSIKQE